MHVSGSYAYVADGWSGLQVIDISNPVNPAIVGACDTPSAAEGVYVAGSHAYVADYSSGLQVIDISDPSNPAIVGTCDTAAAWGVHVSGGYAYVADWGSGLQVIDIRNPSNPAIVGTCDTPCSAHRVHVAGGYAYVADGCSGLQVIGISNPVNSAIVGACDTPGYAFGVHVAGDYAYVADYNSGLQVIEKFLPLTNIQYMDSGKLIATVPAGYRPGTYNLHVANPNGGHAVLHNAFTVHGEIEVKDVMMDLPKGWSMISLPVVPQDARLATLFPDAVVLYKYQKGIGYVRVTGEENLEVGMGYWILLNSPQTYLIRGTAITEYTISVADGWHMIGGCTDPAQTMVTTGSIDVIYEYIQGSGYTRVSGSKPLERGKGYWILFSKTSEGAAFKASTSVAK